MIECATDIWTSLPCVPQAYLRQMQPYTPPHRNHISLISGFLARENGLTKINHYANASNLDPASELPAGNFNARKQEADLRGRTLRFVQSIWATR